MVLAKTFCGLMLKGNMAKPCEEKIESPIGDSDDSISGLLLKLSIALGCVQPKLEQHKVLKVPKTRLNIDIKDFRQRFQQFSDPEDVQEQLLQKHRHKLFLHLYRLLVKLEPDGTKRQNYLIFCYQLYTVNQPGKVQVEEMLRYREDQTERLVTLAQSLINLNRINVENTTRSKRNSPTYHTIVFLGVSFKENEIPTVCCNSRGFRWEQSTSQIIYNDESESEATIIDLKTMEKLKKIKDDDANIYKFNLSSLGQMYEDYLEHSSFSSESINMDMSELNIVEIYDSNETSEVGCQIVEPQLLELINKAQQTENQCELSDQAVQTVCSEYSLDATTNTEGMLSIIDQQVQCNHVKSSSDISTSTDDILDDQPELDLIQNNVTPDIDKNIIYPTFISTNLPSHTTKASAKMIHAKKQSITGKDSSITQQESTTQRLAIEIDQAEEISDSEMIAIDMSIKQPESISTSDWLEIDQPIKCNSVKTTKVKSEFTLDLLITQPDRTITQTEKMVSQVTSSDHVKFSEEVLDQLIKQSKHISDRTITQPEKVGPVDYLELGSDQVWPQTDQSTNNTVQAYLSTKYPVADPTRWQDQQHTEEIGLPIQQRSLTYPRVASEMDQALIDKRCISTKNTASVQLETVATGLQPERDAVDAWEENKSKIKPERSVRQRETTPPSVHSTVQVEPAGWQHQRHIVAASRFIVRQFHCNPAYQCSPRETDAPNFFEQLTQLHEVVAPYETIINVTAIERRFSYFQRNILKNTHLGSEQCIPEFAKCQLKNLLTTEEQREYEALRWQQRDRGLALSLSPEERLRDALHGMLGYECQQLRVSALSSRLMLRSPHHQQSISESFLLLSLAEVGYHYRCLQQQQHRLDQLGECGRALTPCLLAELRCYSQFYERHKKAQPKSLIQLFWQTRSFLHCFQWLLHLCGGLGGGRQTLLQQLQQQLGEGNDTLLHLWLQSAADPLLARITDWLLNGELPKTDFFIVDCDTYPRKCWMEQFELVPAQLPHFLAGHRVAQELLETGRNRYYARRFLGRQLSSAFEASQLQQELRLACGRIYRELDEQPLVELINGIWVDTSKQLLAELQQLEPKPLELFGRLHQYLMTADVEFVRKLIEQLEPLLEQPAACYSPKELNGMLEELQSVHNRQLYVAWSPQPGNRSWCCFLLRWQLPTHWKPLLGHRLPQYDNCFVCLWRLHYADYVLNERIRRQQAHFRERSNLEHCLEARQVRDRFELFIDGLQLFMHHLRSYILEDVLASAFENLYYGCMSATTWDELLALHGAYLNRIERGIWLGGPSAELRRSLAQLYELIIQLDAVHQKFLSPSQLFNHCLVNCDGAPLQLRCSCQNTCDAIGDLEQQFQLALGKFLLQLYGGEAQLVTLARKLDENGYYERLYKENKIKLKKRTFQNLKKF